MQPAHLTRPALVLAVAAVLSGLLPGCAAKPKVAVNISPQLQTLDDLPPLTLPDPATQPSEPGSAEALQLYAQGRDALLQNRKNQAQKLFVAALQIDPSSAVTHHDLGYAYLGLDNGKAEVEFRQAIGYDPLDADSRVQLARLLVVSKRYGPAIEQLRLARQSPDFEDDDSLAAMTDLLLGRLLQHSRPAAALQCYEHVIALLDSGKIQLHGRPELAELLRQPDVLTIQAGDLALQTDQFEKAAAFYERVKQDNPQAAGVLEMRIAAAELAAGHSAQATRRALAIVERQHASYSSVASFQQLFARTSADNTALQHLDALPPAADEDVSSRHVLRSVLLIDRDPAAAVREIEQATRFDLPAVRQLVHAYRAANRQPDLIVRLIGLTAEHADQWPSLARGWAVLAQLGQPAPLAAEVVENTKVAANWQAAQYFVAAQLRSEQGEPVRARQLALQAQQADPKLARQLIQSSAVPLVPDDAFDDAAGLSGLLLDDSDDPQLLSALIDQLLQQGQKAILQEALHLANVRQPANVVIATTYARVLAADEQRTEAITVLDHAQAAKSAGELYFLSAQYSGLGDDASAEKVLRAAYAIDPDNAAVCNDLGFLLIDQGRDLDFAGPLVKKAADQHPYNPAYLDSVGWLYYKQSRFDVAIGYLEKANNACDPADPGVLDHTGDAYYRNKQIDLAARSWNAAIEAISKRGSSDSQLRLRLENKLKQAAAKQAVDLAPLAIKN